MAVSVNVHHYMHQELIRLLSPAQRQETVHYTTDITLLRWRGKGDTLMGSSLSAEKQYYHSCIQFMYMRLRTFKGAPLSLTHRKRAKLLSEP